MIATAGVCTGTVLPVMHGGQVIAIGALRLAGVAMESVQGIGDAEDA